MKVLLNRARNLYIDNNSINKQNIITAFSRFLELIKQQYLVDTVYIACMDSFVITFS